MIYEYQGSKTVPPIEIKPHPDYIISPDPSLEQNEDETGVKDCGCGCGGNCKGKKRMKIVAGIILLIGIAIASYFALKKK